MDPIEDIFNAMRVQSALYARLEAKAPWGISFGVGDATRFAIVVRGHCWLSGPDLAQPLVLTSGDCFIAKADACFVVQDDLRTPSQPCSEIFSDSNGNTTTIGGIGASTEIVSGRFFFDSDGGEPLMSLLPSILHIRMDNERTHLLQATLQLLALETAEQSIGARFVVNRLADILFMQAVRAHCVSHDGPRAGWLAAVMDGHLGVAIRAVHGDIGRHWTVESLASVAGMSRSAFAHHFKEVVGDTPLNYLTRWRMYHAKALLRQGNLALIQIAARIGYETDGAFNRAFKRAEGITPGEYRRRLGCEETLQ